LASQQPHMLYADIPAWSETAAASIRFEEEGLVSAPAVDDSENECDNGDDY
jgi:hypothetical protein